MHARVFAATMVIVSSLWASTVFGQCCGSVSYMPATPTYAAYYAPAAAYYAPSVSYAAYYPAPYAAYYAPAAAYYAPPVSYAAYYAAPYAAYYAPSVAVYPGYYARPGWSAFGAPRVYVAGQPVRNAVRAVTP
jgi:hypothetical protein